MKNIYVEPEFCVVEQSCEDILTSSGGDDFNTRGDQLTTTYYKNTNWLIDM